MISPNEAVFTRVDAGWNSREAGKPGNRTSVPAGSGCPYAIILTDLKISRYTPAGASDDPRYPPRGTGINP